MGLITSQLLERGVMITVPPGALRIKGEKGNLSWISITCHSNQVLNQVNEHLDLPWQENQRYFLFAHSVAKKKD